MRKFFLLLSVFLIFSLLISGCAPKKDTTPPHAQQVWQKTYGGSDSGDEASSIQQTNDGGYIVAGWTDSFGAGSADFYIIKLDSNGNKVWEKTYGGEYYDWASSIQQTKDGGYIVAGTTNSFGAGSADFYIIKTDSEGNTGPYPTQ
ncbi:MAG: hypothetical protein ACP5QT_09330 [Brevinematia bacterium]